MTFKDLIDCISKFEFEKKAIIDGLLQAETNEEKITALRILSRHDLLSCNGWIGDCPDFIYKIVKKQDINRYETRYFMYYLEFAADDVYENLLRFIDFSINIKEYKGCLRISIYKKEFINKLNMFNCPKLKKKWMII